MEPGAMSPACPLCESTAIDQWDLCRRIEESRGSRDGIPSFVTVKRELDEEYGVGTTVTDLKQHAEEHMHVSAGIASLVRAQLYGDVYERVLDDVSRTPPHELADTLPNRPLTESELSVLASHPKFEAVHGEPLDSRYSGLPPNFEDDVHALWIEVDDEIHPVTFQVEGSRDQVEYSPSMDFGLALEWEQRDVLSRDDLLDQGMLYRDDYYHVPEKESLETEAPSVSGDVEFAKGQPLDPEDVRDLPSDEIVEWLGRFGVEFSEDRFLESIQEYHSAFELAEHWWDTYTLTASGHDEDFIWIAAMVLWERFDTPVESSEQLDRMMQDGYDRKDTGDVIEACRLWLDVWSELKKRFTEEMTHIHDADERVFSGLQSLYNWCQDLDLALKNAGRRDPQFFERRIEYSREFCEQFPETDELIVQNMRRAEAVSLYELGRIEEGEAAFERLTAEYPDYGWGYIKWGDMYRESFHGEHATIPDDTARAARHYRNALSRDIDSEAETAARNRLSEIAE